MAAEEDSGEGEVVEEEAIAAADSEAETVVEAIAEVAENVAEAAEVVAEAAQEVEMMVEEVAVEEAALTVAEPLAIAAEEPESNGMASSPEETAASEA